MTDTRTSDAAGHYTTLLLDADGTLLDFNEAERSGVIQVIRSFGLEATDERIGLYHRINQSCWQAFERGDITRDQIFERRYPQFLGALGLTDVDNTAVEKMYRGYLDSCAATIDGAHELCAYLKEHYDLYIITNGVAATQHRRMNDSGLDLYFTDIFISESVGSQKPQKAFFDYCLERIAEKDLRRMLVIGDSLTSDIRGGINAGIDTCWVNLIDDEPDDAIRPDYEVHSLAELMKLL